VLALNEREQTRHEQHKHVLNEAKNNAVAANVICLRKIIKDSTFRFHAKEIFPL